MVRIRRCGRSPGNDPGRGNRGGLRHQWRYTAEFLEEYAVRWRDSDPFRRAETQRLLTSAGVVSMDAVPGGVDYLARVLRPRGISNKLGSVIDCGAAGVLYVGTAVRDASDQWRRDLAVLHRLRRHLGSLATPLLQQHRDRSAEHAGTGLTPREFVVARLAAEGLSNDQIARRLFVGVDTVKKHLSRAFAKSGYTSRSQLAARWPHVASAKRD